MMSGAQHLSRSYSQMCISTRLNIGFSILRPNHNKTAKCTSDTHGKELTHYMQRLRLKVTGMNRSGELYAVV